MIVYILEVLLFALAVAVLLSWGYVKKQKKDRILLEKLYKKAKMEILKEMQRQELTKKEIEKVIKDLKASVYWSRKSIQILAPKKISKVLIDQLLQEKKIVSLAKGSYAINKKGD